MKDPRILSYYERLDISEDADQEEIKAARKRLVKELHSDHKSGPYRTYFDDLLKGVNEAYDTLKDPQKRAKYDGELADQRRAEENQQQAEEAQRRREAEAQAAEERRKHEEESRWRDNQQQSEEQRRREKERQHRENQQRAEEARRRQEAEARDTEERRRREEESRLQENRHSRMGITSFVLSLLSSVVLVLLFLGPTFWLTIRFGPMSMVLTASGLAVGFGVAGIKQRRRRKVFAILGVILSAALLLVSLPLWATSPR